MISLFDAFYVKFFENRLPLAKKYALATAMVSEEGCIIQRTTIKVWNTVNK